MYKSKLVLLLMFSTACNCIHVHQHI